MREAQIVIGSWRRHYNTIGPTPQSDTSHQHQRVVPIIVIYFFALTFLGVYLITRLYLTSAFLQTMGMLAGTEERAPDLSRLKERLDAALKTGKADDLKAAMTYFNDWDFSGTERDDPDLNAKLARILAKQMASGARSRAGNDDATELKNMVAKAAVNPVIKGQLKIEADAGQMTTGDPNLDAEIGNVLS